MPRMIVPSATSGFGQCTWYRSIRRVPSRLALATARCSTTGASGSTGSSFVATNTDSRRSPSASPKIRSLRPKPYISAVSNSVTPRSTARRTISRAARPEYASPYPHSLAPNCHVPRPILEILGLVPTSRYRMPGRRSLLSSYADRRGGDLGRPHNLFGDTHGVIFHGPGAIMPVRPDERYEFDRRRQRPAEP